MTLKLGERMEMVVYHDEHYASSWINKEWSKEIVKYLEEKGLNKKNAIQLREWIEAKLDENSSHESAIIFSQDMVPETILGPLNSPNDLIRRYLDAGGRVVWIGDHPFWSKAVIRKNKDREEIWMHGAHYGMLGVEMLIAESSSQSQWIGEWAERMKSRWYSQRPVNIEVDEERLNLKIEPLAYAEVVLLPSSWNALVIARWKKAGRKIGSFGLTAAGFGGNVTLTEKFPRELSFKPLKLACAWHVSFNRNHPSQGFYRLWDSGSVGKHPPNDLLEDIYTLASLK